MYIYKSIYFLSCPLSTFPCNIFAFISLSILSINRLSAFLIPLFRRTCFLLFSFSFCPSLSHFPLSGFLTLDFPFRFQLPRRFPVSPFPRFLCPLPPPPRPAVLGDTSDAHRRGVRAGFSTEEMSMLGRCVAKTRMTLRKVHLSLLLGVCVLGHIRRTLEYIN